jgi:exosortase/archaeosortase family protein
VQWPWRIENPLTQGLMRLDTNITVEILGWLNIPAVQRGNLIELATGTVGVNEACSGIRSFQSTLMAALFLGELYLLRRRTRLLLVAGGLALAFGFNVVRTLILAWQANAHGLSALEKWHDPAGFTITIACFLVLWAVAVWIKNRTTGAAPPTSDLRPLTSGNSDSQPSTLNPQPSDQLSTLNSQPSSAPSPHPSEASQLPSSASGPRFPLSAFYFQLFFVAWVPFVLLANQAWYRIHDAKHTRGVHWSVTLPETKPTFGKVEIPPRTYELLRYDAGIAGKWQQEDGSDWSVYFFRWEGNSMQSIMHSRTHRPEVCLPAAGLQQLSHPQMDFFETGPLRLAFEKSTYSAQGKPLYVFYCIWQDGDERREGLRSRDAADRLVGALEGSRRFGQQKLEIIVSGYSSMAEAERAVRQRLPDLIRGDS